MVSLSLAGLGVGLLPQKVAREYVLTAKLKENQENARRVLAHNISIALPLKVESAETDFIYNELARFLSMWSQR